MQAVGVGKQVLPLAVAGAHDMALYRAAGEAVAAGLAHAVVSSVAIYFIAAYA